MKAIVGYQVVSAANVKALGAAVNKLVAKPNYRPWGQMQVVVLDGKAQYLQPIVRTKEV